MKCKPLAVYILATADCFSYICGSPPGVQMYMVFPDRLSITVNKAIISSVCAGRKKS